MKKNKYIEHYPSMDKENLKEEIKQLKKETKWLYKKPNVMRITMISIAMILGIFFMIFGIISFTKSNLKLGITLMIIGFVIVIIFVYLGQFMYIRYKQKNASKLLIKTKELEEKEKIMKDYIR